MSSTLSRPSSPSSSSSSTTTTAILVPNTPLAELEALLTAHGGRWTLSADGKGLERRVTFRTFRRTRVYNKAFIRLTTHKDKASGQSGISAKDLDFARFCDSAIGDDDISTETGSRWGADLTAQISEAAHLPEMADPPGEGK
ncbi:hypothetical protein MMC15_007028 [Xylographa vitiligo]|nr:hypothetical protein [Xylographa vitiligo]